MEIDPLTALLQAPDSYCYLFHPVTSFPKLTQDESGLYIV